MTGEGLYILEEIKELQKTLMDLRLEMRELVTEVRGLRDFQKEVDNGFKDFNKGLEAVKETASKARDSASSAHKRMDRIEKIHWWIFTAIGSAVIVSVVAFALKGGLVK